jgi:hypothetical protein
MNTRKDTKNLQAILDKNRAKKNGESAIKEFHKMHEYIIKLEAKVENLALSAVVNWLPFEEGNYELFTQLAKKKKLLKCYDDGTIIKDGEKEPLAIMTHFAEEI